MSLSSTKEQLVRLLADKETKVIALSGKWGTGKSYMWEEVKKAAADDQVKGALYASLFGLSTIAQVRTKLIQSALPADIKGSGWVEGVKQVGKALEKVRKEFGLLDDVELLFAPAVLRNKLIVIDDIERKHDKLGIDELLGLIDDFTQRCECRVLLILNSDQLAEWKLWQTMREKVVDEELRLTTSCAEAFDIAAGLSRSKWAPLIRGAVETCGIINIRIIRKIIRVLDRILADRADVSSNVVARIVPSTVLLAAIHYKGIEGAPDLSSAPVQARAFVARGASKAGKELAEDAERLRIDGQWALLLKKLGIGGFDDYETLVIEYLQSGLYDRTALAAILDRYDADAEVMAALASWRAFAQRADWEHAVSEAQLLEEARSVVEMAQLLDPYTLTALHDVLVDLGDQEMANQAVDRWIAGPIAKTVAEMPQVNPFGRKLHQRIVDGIKLAASEAQGEMSIVDACESLVRIGGWGAREEKAMRQATADSIEIAIRDTPMPALRVFVLKMLELSGSKANYESYFGGAMENFVEACRRIASDQSSGRLGKLVRRLFQETNRLGELSQTEPVADTDASLKDSPKGG